jgi:hypothetical protein
MLRNYPKNLPSANFRLREGLKFNPQNPKTVPVSRRRRAKGFKSPHTTLMPLIYPPIFGFKNKSENRQAGGAQRAIKKEVLAELPISCFPTAEIQAGGGAAGGLRTPRAEFEIRVKKIGKSDIDRGKLTFYGYFFFNSAFTFV